jgi:hypothetical protein
VSDTRAARCKAAVRRAVRRLFGLCPKCGSRLRKGSAYHPDGRAVGFPFGSNRGRYCPELHWGYYDVCVMGEFTIRYTIDQPFDAVTSGKLEGP